jgi:PhoH-like ATPase
MNNYILDTNVLIHFLGCVHTFQDSNIITPLLCLKELDDLKNKEGIEECQAKVAIRGINDIRKCSHIHNEVVAFDILEVVH